eukprot:TRINITY_DN2130_c0_g1_i1.p1 TRINITY_DN2130_c0_g1~~TRINITY_DN2130_c0_g1_i1.p1  ORF type:complete len:118 (-),score=21.39 TRINITY_DN2130_c0_g1_i1:107-460(-)
MIVDVHFGSGNATVSQEDLAKIIGKMYRVKDVYTIFFFGFRVKFGGGRSTGMCLIYDDLTSAIKYEPGYRLHRNTVVDRRKLSCRKQRRELKNRSKKYKNSKKPPPGPTRSFNILRR